VHQLACQAVKVTGYEQAVSFAFLDGPERGEQTGPFSG
jgi:hypothetical protein